MKEQVADISKNPLTQAKDADPIVEPASFACLSSRCTTYSSTKVARAGNDMCGATVTVSPVITSRKVSSLNSYGLLRLQIVLYLFMIPAS
jgi:hypothetical protein